MPCRKRYVRIRAKDVGRKGHHYIKIGVRKTNGPRGGRTEKIGAFLTMFLFLELYKMAKR